MTFDWLSYLKVERVEVSIFYEIARVCRLTYILVTAAKVVKVAVLLAIDHLGLHLVVRAHVTTLLLILKVRFDLLHSEVLCTLPQILFVKTAILGAPHLLLHYRSSLLLHVQVLDSLV